MSSNCPAAASSRCRSGICSPIARTGDCRQARSREERPPERLPLLGRQEVLLEPAEPLAVPDGEVARPQVVLELQAFLGPVGAGQPVQAVPGGGLEVPLWILGSSLFGANLAAELGLPYAFASHFAPAALIPALHTYRSAFKPSKQIDAPYTMAGVNVFAAETDAEARLLFTSAQQQFANLLRGSPGRLPPPVPDIEAYWTPVEKAQASAMLACSFVGSPETVRTGLSAFAERTGVDEIIVASAIYDHAARLRSYEILAGIVNRDPSPAPAAAPSAI